MTEVTPLAWIAAGAAFVLYPALRPYADETAMPGLAAMASDRWVLAHLIGMAAFVLLAVGVRALTGPRTTAVAVLAVVLLLPYYGGEAFALHAVGRRAVATDDVGLLAVVDGFRYSPVALTLFGAGLVSLAVLGVLLVVVSRSADRALRWALVPVAVGLLLYLPQFYGTPALRIGHGVLLGLGCVAVGVLLLRGTSAGQRITPTVDPAEKPGNTTGRLAPGNREATTSPSTVR